MSEAVRAIGVTDQNYYRWRAEFGDLKLDKVRQLRELERENARLRVLLKTAGRPNWGRTTLSG